MNVTIKKAPECPDTRLKFKLFFSGAILMFLLVLPAQAQALPPPQSILEMEAVVFPVITILDTDTHPISDFSYVLEYTGSSIWLHLYAPRDEEPISSVFVLNTISPINGDEIDDYDRLTPPLLKSFANEKSFSDTVDLDAFYLAWNEAGNALAVIYENETRALLLSNRPLGFSIAVAKNCPYAKTWNRRLYRKIFRNLDLIQEPVRVTSK